eukprot:scaffold10678_cov92-Isochrysis_galbana.AAC.6
MWQATLPLPPPKKKTISLQVHAWLACGVRRASGKGPTCKCGQARVDFRLCAADWVADGGQGAWPCCGAGGAERAARGRTAMSVTRCPCHVRIALPSTCHRMTCLSSPAEMKRSPVGSQAHEVTPHLCLEKVRTQAAESVSHSLSTVSLPHDSSRRSSGDHAR